MTQVSIHTSMGEFLVEDDRAVSDQALVDFLWSVIQDARQPTLAGHWVITEQAPAVVGNMPVLVDRKIPAVVRFNPDHVVLIQVRRDGRTNP